MKSFHAQTVAVKPFGGDRSSFWVAVLHHDKRVEGDKEATDYLWIKCNKKLTVKTVREQYEKLRSNIGEVFLKRNSKLAHEGASIGDLDTHEDHVIEFEAVLSSELGARSPEARRPLQPLSKNKKASPRPPSAGFKIPPHTSPFLPKKVKSETFPTPKFDAKPIPLTSSSPPSSSEQSGDENLKLSGDESPELSGDEDSEHSGDENSEHSGDENSAQSGDENSEQSEVESLSSNLPRDPHVPTTIKSEDPPLNDATDQTKGMEHVKSRNPQFARYLADSQHRILKERPRLNDHEIIDKAWLEWASLDPSSRAQYYIKSEPPTEASYQSPYPGSLDPGYPIKSEDELLEDHEDAPKTFQLQSLVADASLELLEMSVERGVKFLDDLKGPLQSKVESSPDAAQWLEQIERLQKSAVKTKTIIGVVGNTGAGKSSVINAMLDEERLLPTNCMRACTACPTQISYNHGEVPYRAEIEFIGISDWERELNILFDDLFDGSGNVSRDCANQDTDAGVAYAKIKAVYPMMTKEDLAESSVKELLREVSHILGKTRTVADKDSLIFYKHLQSYVDSKEKSSTEKDKEKDKKKGEPKPREMWPLIKIVSIYVKAPALETGAVIVDLPGVHDSNAARAAVAENFMKQCTGLWIVAPINRAVDDKAAKALLGDTFKRQLKMDGGFNLVSFICSKCDDISLTEAQDSLGLDAQMVPKWAEIEELEQKQKDLAKQIEELKDTKEAYGNTASDADEQLEIWEGLKDDAQDGKTVFAPRSTTKKRKRSKSSGSQRKKRQRPSDSEGDADYRDESEKSDESDQTEDERTPSRDSPLSLETINQKVTDLREAKKNARRERSEIDSKFKDLKKRIQEAKEAAKAIEGEMEHLCINGRNEYSSKAIQQDFAAGIKELDQELAAEEDEANFNPEEEARDYDEVARSLPVFCVSSRGYQKLQGRFKKDPPVRGFKTLKETQIPQLQEHCKNLTIGGRTASCKRFMTNLSQLLNSMSLWASNDENGVKMTPEQRVLETRVLHGNLQKLENGLEELITDVTKDLKTEFENNIYERYGSAIATAREEASKTAGRWGAPINRGNRAAGGYFWSTYRAICRHNGVYSNAQGPHDWNSSLIEPMIKILVPGWERTFTRRMKHVLNSLPTKATTLIRVFHQDVDIRARRLGAGIASLHTLHQQLQVYEDIFKDLATTTRDSISAQQREINREFVPIIESAMQNAYDACSAECGTGSFMRMKASMTGHVDQARNSMFDTSADNVKKQLNKMLRDVEEAMSNRADDVFLAMRRDYRSVLGGEDMPQGEVMPKWAKEMRREVSKLIDGVEERFTKIEESKSEKIKHEDLEMDTMDGDEQGKEPAEGDKESKEEDTDANGVEIKGNVSDDQPTANGAASDHKPEKVGVDDGTSRTINDGNLLEGLDRQNGSGQLPGDTEMVDVQPTTTPQAVEDSCSSSPVENVLAVPQNGSKTQENDEQADNMDGNKKASTNDFNDILDW